MSENPTPDDCRRMSTGLAHAFNKGPKSTSPQEVGDAIAMLAWAGAKIERLEAEVTRLTRDRDRLRFRD